MNFSGRSSTVKGTTGMLSGSTTSTDVETAKKVEPERPSRSGDTPAERRSEKPKIEVRILTTAPNLSGGSSTGREAEKRDLGESTVNVNGGLQAEVKEGGEHQCEKLSVGGSNPSHRAISAGAKRDGLAKRKFSPFQFRLREPLGWEDCPYAYRTTFNLGLFSIRIHEWHRSDDKRNMHDHPWPFLTLVLRGSYVDVSEKNGIVVRDQLRAGSIRFRPATHRHYVEVPPGGALTILLTTKKLRDWGFWVKGKFTRPLRYFGKFHHPPCSE
jgi:hypothetical protein